MPKFFCDYCDVYLTHDSMSVRKAHNAGRNHLRNVVEYYQQIGHEKAQSVIDSITSSYAESGQANPMLSQTGPMGFGPPPPGFPPPLPGLPGMPVPPFMPPGGAGMIPPPNFNDRNMPFAPFPGMNGVPPPNMPNMPNMPNFPPPGFPANFPPPTPGANNHFMPPGQHFSNGPSPSPGPGAGPPPNFGQGPPPGMMKREYSG